MKNEQRPSRALAGLRLDAVSRDRILQRAAEFDCHVERGSHAGEPSIVKLNEAIASDRLLLAEYPEDRAAWDTLRNEFASDSATINYLLNFYLDRLMPDDGAILGWNPLVLRQPQPCYLCGQSVVGDAYQVIGKTLFAHAACLPTGGDL